MRIIAILAVLVFAAVLAYIEIPKLFRDKSYKELWSFSILLLPGVTLSILKSLGVSLFTPSDWIAWVFSPLTNLIKPILK